MRKSLLVIAFGLLGAQVAFAGDSTKTAVGGGVGAPWATSWATPSAVAPVRP